MLKMCLLLLRRRGEKGFRAFWANEIESEVIILKELKIHKLQPAVFGVIICVFLVISRFLGNAANSHLLSLNTVLILVILWLSVHLVRRTSELFQPHVWNSPWAFVLLLMPLINLVVTGLQFIADAPAFFGSAAFNAVLIFVSMPVFMCVYFAYVAFKLPSNKAIRKLSLTLCFAGLVYIVFRLVSVLAYADLSTDIFTHYSDISLVIYILSVACFIFSAYSLRSVAQN